MGRGILIPVIEVGCLPTSNPECRISGIVLLLCPLVELLLLRLLPLGAIVELLLATWARKKPQEAHETYSLRTASLHLCASCPSGALVEVLLPHPEILNSGLPVGIDPTPYLWGGVS